LRIVAITPSRTRSGRSFRREADRFCARAGGIAVIDAAQGGAPSQVDVQALGCDFLAFSGHKMCGPSGVGVLYGRSELLEQMSPFLTGGGMIRRVSVERPPGRNCANKFEAGTAG